MQDSLIEVPEEILKELSGLEEQSKKLNFEIVNIKRKYGIGRYCCKTSEASNGWHHEDDCPNWRTVD